MATTDSLPPGESENQKQARLRRERRNAKLKEGGSERLNKITSLSGRPAAAEAELSRTPSPSAKPIPSTTPQARSLRRDPSADDPDEVDISNMFSRQPDQVNPNDQSALFRQMLASTGAQPPSGMQMPDGQFGGPAGPGMDGAEDPMAQMMEMLMGGAGMGGMGGTDGPLAGLSSMFGGQQARVTANSTQYIWRIVHAVIALVIGLYAAFGLTFTGSEYERVATSGPGRVGGTVPRIFVMFVTAELVLQASRYFVDQGKPPATGILATVGRFLPQPIMGYVLLLSSWSVIWFTIVSDAMVIVFILGCVAWWNGPLPAI